MENKKEIKVLDKGIVKYINHLGSDKDIIASARVSYGADDNEVRTEEQDRKLLEYLFKNRHTSPFESCNITFYIKMPIFVMRQFVRHRTFRLNEISGRYKQLPNDFYIPDIENVRKQSKVNKQGSEGQVDKRDAYNFIDALNVCCQSSYNLYENFIEMGIGKEQARMILPLNIYTEIRVSVDVHNLLHFLYLREDVHAQWEIREFARAMREIAEELFPMTFELYKKYKPVMQKVLIEEGDTVKGIVQKAENGTSKMVFIINNENK